MTQRQRYSRSPLVEVILTWSVKPSVVSDELDWSALDRSLGIHFPVAGIGDEPETLSGYLEGDSGPYITRFDEDRRVAVRASLGTFSLSHSRVTLRWNDIREIGRRAWQAYGDVAQPTSVASVSIRLVNRLNFPGTTAIALGEYLNIVPRSSQELSTVISGYAFEIRMPQTDLEDTLAIVRQATVPIEEVDRSDPPLAGAIILDIEVVRRTDLPWDSADVWTAFNESQMRATQVFEATITDRVRDLIR